MSRMWRKNSSPIPICKKNFHANHKPNGNQCLLNQRNNLQSIIDEVIRVFANHPLGMSRTGEKTIVNIAKIFVDALNKEQKINDAYVQGQISAYISKTNKSITGYDSTEEVLKDFINFIDKRQEND